MHHVSAVPTSSAVTWRHEIFLRGGRVWVAFSWLVLGQVLITAAKDPVHTWWTLLVLLGSAIAMTIAVLVTRVPHDVRAILFISAQTFTSASTLLRGGSGLVVGTLCLSGIVFGATTLSSRRVPWVVFALQLALLTRCWVPSNSAGSPTG